ncbi:MAG: hypothetical protein IK118_04030 [Clostridia bacterium]|nr:hypothetical protein [Clostridia bacterium]MBR5427492.1 hypothetical protein [Clostridia bacterium]
MALPNRKLPRKHDFCYSAREVYFLTICSKNRQKIFSHIIPPENFDAPIVDLTPTGKIVEKYILTVSAIKGVQLENYIIMPDHIHLMIFIDSAIDDNIHCDPTPTDIVPRVVACLKKMINKEVGENVFQKSYYDHIIRNQTDYDRHWDYIDNNPLSWIHNKENIQT